MLLLVKMDASFLYKQVQETLKMIAAVVKLLLVTTLLLLPCSLAQDECRGLDVFPPEIDDLVAKTQACKQEYGSATWL